MRFRVEKLIRDGLPPMMREQGLTVFCHRLGDAEFLTALKAKLLEEAEEVAVATADDLLEELADVSEVLMALIAAAGLSPEAVEAARLAKRAQRGGFEGRVYNRAVAGESGTPGIAYYLTRPDQYPPLTEDGAPLDPLASKPSDS
ncbi:MAG: nucleoside triphosphate pyrophosphohydrolase [Phenylobacterium sp.]|uniref:nucleoside triphosphate pyrophosphohydrolase n=1 Tax=Phenylobacterium sp. TaxID=1871053 RepID=UPI002733EACB|nr:nucleoside triphosphate pyrophosphohydrolase [Phenylobacterium sp.]MDP1642461.1 nucleoside triphosphate pyrophosphohydrolase [Phenylobacterium sp.]MDP3116823.1 nucleoside triphosphate pyrophosphohydrolase [Phenylobacterium sp.]MDP3384261.1 nucleoside triphosphate pyrophosphohydrolase [Phenylobacterium sp.]